MSVRTLFVASLALLACVATSTAHADCVAPLGEVDALLEADRGPAIQLFTFELTSAVGPLEPWPCDAAWTVTHVTIGDASQVMVASPSGGRRLAFDDLASLAAAYTVAIADLTMPEPEARIDHESEPLTTRFHMRLVGGVHLNGEAQTELDPGFGFGVRMMGGRAGLDLSAFNMTMDEGRPSGDWLRIMPVVNFVHADRVSAMQGFGGVGFGWSTVRYEDPEADIYESADGLELDLVVGWSFMEQLPVKPFVQFEAGLPLFQVEVERETQSGGRRISNEWTPNVAMSIGFGANL